MKKKYLFFIVLFLGAFATKTNAQDSLLNSKMKAFYKYCLAVREGIQKENVDILKKSILGWSGSDSLKFDSEDLVIVKYPDVSNVQIVNSIGQIPLAGHMEFTPCFVDNWILNHTTKIEDPELVVDSSAVDISVVDKNRERRDTGFYSCFYVQTCIAANKEVTYELSASGICELFVISEYSEPLSVIVQNPESKEEWAKGESDKVCLKWDIDSNNKYLLTIKNLSQRDQSLIFATN